jgi:hypothetical protein
MNIAFKRNHRFSRRGEEAVKPRSDLSILTQQRVDKYMNCARYFCGRFLQSRRNRDDSLAPNYIGERIRTAGQGRVAQGIPDMDGQQASLRIVDGEAEIGGRHFSLTGDASQNRQRARHLAVAGGENIEWLRL